MTSSLTPRDKWLAAILPGLALLLFGWLFVLRPSGRELGLARQRLQNQGPLSGKQAALAQAEADRTELTQAIAAKRAGVKDTGSVFDRNTAMQQVSLLCSTHGLSLNKAEVETGGKLPVALKNAGPAFGSVGTPPQVWRIELTGSYPSVVKLLEGLQTARPLIVPLTVAMQSGRNERIAPAWVLTLWL